MTEATEDTPLVSGVRLDDTYKDDIKDLTLGRRLARHLSKYEWYNPHLNKDPKVAPNLDKAWAYFEHVTLARHFPSNEGAVDVNRKAEPGECQKPTQLYSVTKTPESDLGDFGIGVGIYFYTLRTLSVIMLIAGLINIPNLLYYFSSAFNGTDEGIHLLSLRASAICTDESWVPCPSCTKDDWDVFPRTYSRYAEAIASDGSILSFVKKNNCHITNGVGLVSYLSLLYVCYSVYVLSTTTKEAEIMFDNAALTTTDFAVEVSNPPTDAREPEEWKAFFEQFGQVKSVTVALDNELLINALLTRRKLVMALKDLQPQGITVDPLKVAPAAATALPLTTMQKMMMMSDGETLKQKIAAIDDSIASDLAQRHYDVSNVFVIFEKTSAQQEALLQMCVPGIHIVTNNASALPENLRFRGKHVLEVVEPPEPSSVRWQDLQESFFVQLRQRLVTYSLTFLLIFASCLFVVKVRNNYGIVYGALAISGINTMFPQICFYITMMESHPSETSKQASNYFKITLALWFLTAILTSFVTPFTDTLNETKDSLIPAMYSIFITQLLTTPITQLLDLPGHVYRHILAPRALDQRRMNAYFSGAYYQLSDRYTDMTNVLFLTFYYAMIYPAGFFWAAATLAVHYWVDKFCLLRTWAPAPSIGTTIAEMSRLYFFTASLVSYALMSSYNFASFPYDNTCDIDQNASGSYVGTFSGKVANGVPVEIVVSEGDPIYKYCNQDMLRYKPWPAFPAVPSSQPEGGEWMTDGQEFAAVFGWTSVVVIIFVIFFYLNVARKSFNKFLFGGFVNHDKPSDQGFSELGDIFGYIPQFKLIGASYPTLLCDISNVSEGLIDWEDASDPSRHIHNAIYDVPDLVDKKGSDGVLSLVKEWP